MQDADNDKPLFENTASSKPQQEPRNEMSRGTQTAWIVGVMLALAVGAYEYTVTHNASDPYAECRSIFRADKLKCRATIAAASLMRGSY